MNKPINLDAVLTRFRERWQGLNDQRKPSNALRYSMSDVALSAFAVFFIQSPSFLAHQRDMAQRKGCSNAEGLFQIKKVPSDNQIRNIMDGVAYRSFREDFDGLHEALRQSRVWEDFRGYAGTHLLALDGTTYFSSEELSCEHCLQRADRAGKMHHYHSAVTPVWVKVGSSFVLPMLPECIEPQDGAEKQDCERAAAKRWLAKHAEAWPAHSVTILGDDLYANHPLCALIAETYQQYFICTAKPDSHPTLYSWLDMLEKGGGIASKQERVWRGKHAELWTYRWAEQIPLRAEQPALHVSWFELTITRADTGKQVYHNTWVTNHIVNADTVKDLALTARARWKIENENNNVLKNHGYHLEHNFGHGQQQLSNTLFTLNLLAFLLHTVQDLLDEAYRLVRTTLSVRRTFFDDLRALTRYQVFDSWNALWRFMLDGLEVPLPQALLLSG